MQNWTEQQKQLKSNQHSSNPNDIELKNHDWYAYVYYLIDWVTLYHNDEHFTSPANSNDIKVLKQKMRYKVKRCTKRMVENQLQFGKYHQKNKFVLWVFYSSNQRNNGLCEWSK